MFTISIKGLNLNRLIDEMLSKSIMPKSINRVAYDEIIIEISSTQYKNLVDLKSISCYNVSVLKHRPKFNLMIMTLKRLGFVVGLAVALFLLSVTSNKIWDINVIVTGENSDGVEGLVYEALSLKGIGVGQRFKLNTRDLEKELLSLIDDCASVVVTKNGIVLDIAVKTRVYKPELSTADIVAKFDGKITEINLTSGILSVNIGEGVQKGQVLIASGLVGDFYAEAIGEIKAKVLVSGESVGSTKLENVTRSGAFYDVVAFEIFGKTIYFNAKEKDFSTIFKNYEVERSEIFVSNNLCLPLKKVVFRVFELKSEEIMVSPEEVVENLKKQALINAENNLPDGADVFGVTYDVFEDNGYYKVVCNLETEIEIGIRK